MKFVYTVHWRLKKQYRREDISDGIIEYAIQHSKIIKDRRWDDVYNAIYRIPHNGRILKIAYKFEGIQTIKIITAYWLD